MCRMWTHSLHGFLTPIHSLPLILTHVHLLRQTLNILTYHFISQYTLTQCVWQKKQKAHVRTWYILVRTACYQIRDRQSRARPDARTCPSGRFTLEAVKQREICRIFFFLTLASEHACINNWYNSQIVFQKYTKI